MTKVIVKISLVLAAASLVSCQGAIDKIFRTEFLQECKANAPKDMDASLKGAFDKFCECSADKVITSMTLSELEEFSKDTMKYMPKVIEVTKPCAEELEKAATAINS